ncbi:hypothetical protein VNO78_14900 [Psophocarpus tetragonolobus]|uniref:Fe2OG dioxygenase domain-containing protein n=1 Tax=Psophocarpus tetragonolobus TaxID=3891 RepID=A0AAN9SD55_PSOTE
MDRMLLSSFYKLHSSVPSSYVQPPERRPGNSILAVGKLVPVIDLGGHDGADIISNVLKASQDYGFFQVMNHGVCKELVDATMNIFKEEKIKESSKDTSCKMYTSSGRSTKDVADYFRNYLTGLAGWAQYEIENHLVSDVGRDIKALSHFFMLIPPIIPRNPPYYWTPQSCFPEVVGKYTQELRKLALQILELLCEGLGLNPEYFCGGYSDNPVLLSHYYPPCPEPSLTLGTSMHKDPNLLTILLQEVGINALQVFKDGEWITVEPIPNTFVVNIGIMLQIISNGRLIAAKHRVITNSISARHSVAYFVNPTKESLIEPAEPLTSLTSPPVFRSMTFGELWGNFLIKGSQFEEELHIHEGSVGQALLLSISLPFSSMTVSHVVAVHGSHQKLETGITSKATSISIQLDHTLFSITFYFPVQSIFHVTANNGFGQQDKIIIGVGDICLFP